VRRPLSPEAFVDEATYAGTRRPVSLATTLIPDAYTSDGFFAAEREHVFGASWVAVAAAAELASPGDAVATEVAGEPLFVVRDRAGIVRAFFNVCRHRGARLLDSGPQRLGRHIRCPYHSWAYGLDGGCLGTPLFDGSGIPEAEQGVFAMGDVERFDKADHGLLPVRVEVWGPLVLVNLDPSAPPLADELGDLTERLSGYRLDEWVTARTARYEIRANWKLVAENYMEYYHLPWVHSSLVKVSPLKSHYRWQGTGMYTGMCTTPIADSTAEGGWKGLPPIPGLSQADAVSARFVWLFPNVALNVLPNHLFLMLARPQAPALTIEDAYLLVHPSQADAPEAEGEIGQLLGFWDVVNREDIGIVERVQEGLAARAYTGGRMCYQFEEPIHRFQNMLVDRIVGIRRVPAGDAVDEASVRG